MRPSVAGAIAVIAALGVVAFWAWRSPPPSESALDATRAVRISRHGAIGTKPEEKATRDRARVREIVAALGVDALPKVECPQDYSTAEFGITLAGQDVYAKRNVYVWDLLADGGHSSVVVVTTSGCTGGPPADESALRRELTRRD